VWGQAIIITPHTVPLRRVHAKEMLMTRVSNYVWKPRPDAIEKAFAMLQPNVRFALDDVVELPPVIERTVDVEFTAQQKQVYKKVATELAAMVKEQKIVAANAGVAMGKLLQIAGGWVYTGSPQFVRLDTSPRTAALTDLIVSSAHKVIVFVPYRHMVEGIAQVFDSNKESKFDYCLVHGDTRDREHLFNAFQNSDKYKVLLAHPGCVHHGLTLTAADTVIWYLPITSLDVYNQANARIRRVGQKHKQQIIHLQGSTVERRIYKLLQNKHNLQLELLEMLEHATEIGG
jgi:SNF2 family DNA or RNA helicase